MKKLLAILFLVLMLVSCGKTDYKDLSNKEKTKIQAEAFALTLKDMGAIFKGKKSGGDLAEKTLKEKYPDINFGDFSELEKDIENMDIGLNLKSKNLKGVNINNKVIINPN